VFTARYGLDVSIFQVNLIFNCVNQIYYYLKLYVTQITALSKRLEKNVYQNRTPTKIAGTLLTPEI
jgi:hypothetical protein